jgi:hypothetical protein
VIQSNTIVRMQTGGLSLDRGSVTVATGNGTSVFARDFKINPASSGWTEFYVSRGSGVIEITARKNGITVRCGPTTSTIKEGQQITRDDAADCGIAQKKPGAIPAAKRPDSDLRVGGKRRNWRRRGPCWDKCWPKATIRLARINRRPPADSARIKGGESDELSCPSY